MRFLIGLIHLSNKIRNFLTDNAKFDNFKAKLIKITGVISAFTVVFVIFMWLNSFNIPTVVQYLLILPLISYPISKAIGEIGSTLNTIKGFMTNGLIFTAIVFFIVAAFNLKVFDLNTLDNFSSDFLIVNSMVIPVLASTVVWLILSCLAETKIAIVGNAVLTGIITLFREILIYVFSFYEKSPEISIRMRETLSPIELELYSKQRKW